MIGEVLDAWCAKLNQKGVDVGKLCTYLQGCRLSYHAKCVRHMVAGTPFDPNYEESKKEGKENIPLEGFHKVFETLLPQIPFSKNANYHWNSYHVLFVTI